MAPAKTLVNFNIQKATLSTFDQLCRLNGKPRSMIINELIYSYILEAGLILPVRMKRFRSISRKLNSASESSFESQMDDMSKNHISSLKSASKSILAADLNQRLNGKGDR